MNFRHLLVPLDGSLLATTALPIARLMALSQGAELRVAMFYRQTPSLARLAGQPTLLGRLRHQCARQVSWSTRPSGSATRPR